MLLIFRISLFKLNFGVRTNDVFLPKYPSITAMALCKESPIETLKNKGKVSKNGMIADRLFLCWLAQEIKYMAPNTAKLKIKKEANKKIYLNSGSLTFMDKRGTLKIEQMAMLTKTALFIKCMMPCHLTAMDLLLFITFQKCFLAVSAPPFVHLYCCDFKALITGGSSAGEFTFSRYTNSQPFN